jgi:urea transport system permease protein
MHSPRAWFALLGFSVFFGVALPLLNQMVVEDSALHFQDQHVLLLGKFACYGMVALAVDLVWGFAGILSLGHCAFFALGGYAMGMYLMRSIGTGGVYRSELPDFMVFLDWKELPWFWYGFDNLWFALLMCMVVPGTLGGVFGYLAFRSRIKGVYLSIITQALTYAMMLLFFRNETGFGGNNGLTDFKQLYGYPLRASSTKVFLYVLSIIALVMAYVSCRYLTTSKFGMVLKAVRDDEPKTRFSGYDTLNYKWFAWTFSTVLCGIAGALYVPQVGIINPSEMEPANSIEAVIWVAIGGRGTLFGPILGALVVNSAKSVFTAVAPDIWLFFLGGLFVVVTLLLPQGLVGLGRMFRRKSLTLAAEGPTPSTLRPGESEDRDSGTTPRESSEGEISTTTKAKASGVDG